MWPLSMDLNIPLVSPTSLEPLPCLIKILLPIYASPSYLQALLRPCGRRENKITKPIEKTRVSATRTGEEQVTAIKLLPVSPRYINCYLCG